MIYSFHIRLSSMLPFLCLAVTLGLMSCSDATDADEQTFKIGVSQCSGGDWRDKMNDEMRREAIFHRGISFEFCCANDDPAKQSRDVDSLIAAGVDLLVLAPIDSITGDALVAKAHEHQLPVIVADRKLGGNLHTAYVGGDNYQVGFKAAEYMASRLPEGGEILEIRGMDGSSPVALRHQGFVDGLRLHPELRLVSSVEGCWLRDSAKVRMEDAIHAYPELRGVYCHNDYMAMGAIEMFRWVRHFQREYGDKVPDWAPVFVGVDAVYGENHGLEWIARGDLDASVLYPTGGDVIVQTALQILNGEPYVRDSILHVSVVDIQGAALLNDMDLAVIHEVGKVHWLQRREISLLRRIDVETLLLIVLGAFFLFIILAMIQMRRHHLERRRTALHLVRANRKLRDAEHLQLEELRRRNSELSAQAQSQPVSLSDAVQVPRQTIDPFVEQVYRLIDEHYSDPNFGVERLSFLLDMSRSQLYRRVKKLSSMTPFDMIREKRFSEAEKLLDQGLSNEEVARQIGFSSAVYFARSYAEYHQMSDEEV